MARAAEAAAGYRRHVPVAAARPVRARRPARRSGAQDRQARREDRHQRGQRGEARGLDRSARHGDPAAAPFHPLGRLPGRRRCCILRARCAVAPSARCCSSGQTRSSRSSSSTSTACPICCSRWRGRRTIAASAPRLPGSCGPQMNQLREAYAACEALAKSHYENFPVASTLMPAHLRPHVAAIYAFARTADDFADEPGRETRERLHLLSEWRLRLHQPGTGNRELSAPLWRLPDPDAVFLALHDTIERFRLPVQLFDDLLDAFVQDVTTTRYSTLGWRARLLSALGKSSGPPGAAAQRLQQRRA